MLVLKTNYGMNLPIINGLLLISAKARLRMKISTEMFNKYSDKVFNFQLADSMQNNIADNQQNTINKPDNLNPIEE